MVPVRRAIDHTLYAKNEMPIKARSAPACGSYVIYGKIEQSKDGVGLLVQRP